MIPGARSCRFSSSGTFAVDAGCCHFSLNNLSIDGADTTIGFVVRADPLMLGGTSAPPGKNGEGPFGGGDSRGIEGDGFTILGRYDHRSRRCSSRFVS